MRQVFEHAIQRAEQRLMHSLRSIMGGDTKQARGPHPMPCQLQTPDLHSQEGRNTGHVGF